MFLCSLILSLLVMVPLGQETASIGVRTTLYEVPAMIISRIIAARSEDGGVVGTMIGGVTTESFPTDPVFLQDRLEGDADSPEIIMAIREYMAHGCIREQDVNVVELARHDLVLGSQPLGGQEVYREAEKRPHRVSYRLIIEPAWQYEEGAGLALQVWLRWQNPSDIQEIVDRLPDQLVVDQVLLLKFGRTSLLGFPSSTSRLHRSIFWLALSAKKPSI